MDFVARQQVHRLNLTSERCHQQLASLGGLSLWFASGHACPLFSQVLLLYSLYVRNLKDDGLVNYIFKDFFPQMQLHSMAENSCRGSTEPFGRVLHNARFFSLMSEPPRTSLQKCPGICKARQHQGAGKSGARAAKTQQP